MRWRVFRGRRRHATSASDGRLGMGDSESTVGWSERTEGLRVREDAWGTKRWPGCGRGLAPANSGKEGRGWRFGRRLDDTLGGRKGGRRTRGERPRTRRRAAQG